MPSIAQVPQDGAGAKKRRWEDAESVVSVVRVCSPQLKHHRSESSQTDHTTLLEEKQLHHLEYKDRDRERERRILPIPSRRESHKRQRIERVPSHNEVNVDIGSSTPLSPKGDAVERTVGRESQPHSPVKKTDLSPCHICHRKPTLKAELDSFADCGACRRRTCWICIRECLGSAAGVGAGRDVEMGEEGRDAGGVGEREGEEGERGVGHRGMVCSRCCVERGTEGEVWCLGCLRAEGGG